jgi:hypothetical protein
MAEFLRRLMCPICKGGRPSRYPGVTHVHESRRERRRREAASPFNSPRPWICRDCGKEGARFNLVAMSMSDEPYTFHHALGVRIGLPAPTRKAMCDLAARGFTVVDEKTPPYESMDLIS